MLLAAVAIGCLFALSIRRTIHGAVSEKELRNTALQVDRAPVDTLPASSAVPLGHENANPPTLADTNSSPLIAETHNPDRLPLKEDDELAEARQAVLDATPRALVTGKPVKWRAGNLKGYVVPSDAQDYDGRTCRNIYATTIEGQDQQEGRAQRWCRPADDDGWAPE